MFPPDVIAGDKGEWIKGRAGMEYRDLIPGRLGGKVVASHIRLTPGGEVADYVHYHKVAFQMIFCFAGAIRVVYEDQGEPFWLRPGDCVLQPPEIRHRVLEAEAGSEVIEIGCPAVHETWVDHEMQLPTVEYRPERRIRRPESSSGMSRKTQSLQFSRKTWHDRIAKRASRRRPED